MTVNKGFKRLVRERMTKTGQGYCQARDSLIRERERVCAECGLPAIECPGHDDGTP